MKSARRLTLAGVVVRERNVCWSNKRLNGFQEKYFPDMDVPVRIHAAPLRSKHGDSVECPFDELTVQMCSLLPVDLYKFANELFEVNFERLRPDGEIGIQCVCSNCE